jgi:hypothetical protein
MAEKLTNKQLHEQQRKIVAILIDSDLYLDMDLKERLRLLQYLLISFFNH